MLSVLHILSSLKLGGAERVTIELAQLQRQKGIKAEILNLGEEGDFLGQVVTAYDIPLHFSSKHDSRLSRYRYIGRLFQQFDVVHFHSPETLKFIVPLLWLHRRQRYIYTRHGLNPLPGFLWHLIHGLSQPCIDYITFVTSSGQQVFEDNYRWPRQKLLVVENGVYIPPTCEKTPAQPLRFGSVGRMVALKGQKLLLEAIALLLKQQGERNVGSDAQAAAPFILHFYGSGPEEEALQTQAEGLAKPCTVFHGQVTDVAGIYDELDVLIVASETEGLSMVIIEAMARGIPVIATRVGGNPTLVSNDETGLLVEYGDVPAMSAAIGQLIDHPEKIKTLGLNARAFISEKYSLELTHQAYLNCYQG